MLKHFLKLTWNRKGKHFLLMFEFFLTFLVLLAIMVFVFAGIGNTFKPLGFEYKKVVVFALPMSDRTQDVNNEIDVIMKKLTEIKEVESVSLTKSPIPFTRNAGAVNILHYGRNDFLAKAWETDENLEKVLSLKVSEGRWFTKEDYTSSIKPIVVNSYFKEMIFAGVNPINKIIVIKEKNEKRKVIGVVQDFRSTGRTDLLEGYFDLNYSNGFWFNSLVKLKQPIDNNSYDKLIAISKKHSSGWNRQFRQIETLDESKEANDAQYKLPIAIMSVVCGFLILNVILGLFSVLWQNINRRKMEIGIRRAVGAHSRQIYSQIILEVVLLVSLALVPAAIITTQLALFKTFEVQPDQYFFSFLVSAFVIYLVVVVSALYPSKLAATIQPAEALHNEQ
jgi:putative ABC transport system permease protein